MRGRLCLLVTCVFLSSSLHAISQYEAYESVGRRPALVDQENTIVIGVILPITSARMSSLPMHMGFPALKIALDHIKEKYYLAGFNINVLKRDMGFGKNADALAPLQAVDLYYYHNVSVFLGPPEKFAVAPIARYSSISWGLPIITPNARVDYFTEHKLTEYEYLTRMSGPPADVAGFFDSIFKKFDWHIFYIYYEYDEPNGGGDCHFEAEGIHKMLRKLYQDYQEKFKTEPRYQGIDPAIFREPKYKKFTNSGADHEKNNHTLVLTEMTKVARIVVLCASPDSVREIMLKAQELNFTNGEYVFFNIDLFSSKNESERPWYRETDSEEDNTIAMRAYEAMLTVTLRKPDSPEYHNFSEKVKQGAKKYENFTYGDDEVNSFVGAFHDAVILYALALNDTLEAGFNVTDGAEITKRMWNRTFEGITGNVSIDENGDRNADYSLLDLNPKSNKFEVVANYYGNRKQYELIPGKTIYWSRGNTQPPPDTPPCGFDNSKCPENEFPTYGIVIIVLGSLLFVVVLAAFFVYRHYRLEAELAEMNWRIRWDDILFSTMAKSRNKMGSRLSLNRKMSIQSDISGDTMAVHLSDMGHKQMFTKTGYYKAALVAIKKVNTHNISITKPLLMEIKKIRDMQNDYIVRFIGACIDPPNQCIVTEYCQKGSLQDVLENDELKLDWMFRYSLMQDIVRGMAYLHGSDVRSHGNLKSSNCVVDSRFVLKITDFALHSLRGSRDELDEEDTYAFYRRKLWSAPELLRLHNPPFGGSQKGDVYSFAIICQEIIYRNGPFFLETLDLSPKEIYQKVKNGQRPYFRPTLDDDECTEQLAHLVRRCWSEDAPDRPDFTSLKAAIKKLNKEGDSGNILDNLLSRMEQYANNLESLVEERTADYLEQKKKAEDLLYMMLPKSVAGQLIRGESVTAESFQCVTIYFSDICGFTAMSAECTAMQVIDLLNDLYTTFDAILEHLDVYKVETIGDAYMVASGLPIQNGNLHAREIARMSLRLLDAVLSFKIRHRPNEQLKLRIGIHSGPVCAGVVGLKMPRYCLFGDTVNTASRMESNGLPLKIHVSPCTKNILDKFGCFDIQLRGQVDMKGKGSVTTFWLLGEKDTNQNIQPTDRESNI